MSSRAVAPLVEHVFPVVLPVVAYVLAVVVIVVPGVVVHVAAAAPSVRTVVIVVVDGCAEGNAGSESDQARRDRLGRVVVFLDDDGGGRRDVDGLRVVLRDVNHLRVRRAR